MSLALFVITYTKIISGSVTLVLEILHSYKHVNEWNIFIASESIAKHFFNLQRRCLRLSQLASKKAENVQH